MGPRSIEWRSVNEGATWHLFIGSKSICKRVYSNGKFDYVEVAPPHDVNKCKFCVGSATKVKERIIEVTAFIG